MRPKIICHMVSSIDGRLLVDRWTTPAAGVDSDIVDRTCSVPEVADEASSNTRQDYLHDTLGLFRIPRSRNDLPRATA